MIKVMRIYTENVQLAEALFDLHGFSYNVEYVPSQHAKTDHFGEVYSTDTNMQSQFSFFTETEFTSIEILLKQHAIDFVSEEIEVVEFDYQQAFEDEYPILEVADFVITPPWKTVLTSAAKTLVISPSTGFGTGQSPTTQLCLHWIATTDFANKRVLDFGSGSGILAIAAAKRGAKAVKAFEIDNDALISANENIIQNQCETVIKVTNVESGQYDILLMNVTAAIFQQFFDDVWGRTCDIAYVSGIQAKQYDEICRFLQMRQLNYTTYQQDGWYGFEVKR